MIASAVLHGAIVDLEGSDIPSFVSQMHTFYKLDVRFGKFQAEC